MGAGAIACAAVWAFLAQPAPPPSHLNPVKGHAFVDGTGFYQGGTDPTSSLWEEGTVRAELDVADRVLNPAATFGDLARFEMTFTLGASVYRVELATAGFPPGAGAGFPRPLRPLGGGVRLDFDVFGATGYGPPLTVSRAAIGAWGLGRVTRDGELVTDRASIEVYALSAGFHADDGTFAPLPEARYGDTELWVLVTALPPDKEPRGFLAFGAHHLAITVGGVDLPDVPFMPTVGADQAVLVPPPAYVSERRLVAPLPPGLSLSMSGPLPPTQPEGPGVAPGQGAVPLPASTVANNGSEPPVLQESPAPANAAAATPLVATPAPANASPGEFFVPVMTSGITPLNAFPAAPLPATPAPGNLAGPSVTLPATPLPQSPTPLNALPATPLPQAPPPLNAVPGAPSPTATPGAPGVR